MRTGERLPYFRRAKGGFVRLLGVDHAKSVGATVALLHQTTWGDERTVELRALWERVKVSLPDEAVTYSVASCLRERLDQLGKYEDSNVFYLASLEGRRRVLGEEHKDTLASLNSMGVVL